LSLSSSDKFGISIKQYSNQRVPKLYFVLEKKIFEIRIGFLVKSTPVSDIGNYMLFSTDGVERIDKQCHSHCQATIETAS